MSVSVPNSILPLTGATSHDHDKMDWHAINWPKAHREVQRLQARIVQAEQAGKRGKVKALQRLLTHSFSGKVLAIKRVTENQGKNTPGVDREIWNTPEKKITALHQLKQRGYQAQPLRRVYINKSNGKLRPLGIPCIKCRAMQALYLLALDPIAEVRADPDSYGFRRGRGCADAIEQCFITLATRYKPQWILEADIQACFDKINHDWLMANIPMDKAMLQKWLKAGFVYKKVLYPTEEGSPQGSIISPVLANMTLDGLAAKLKQAYAKTTSKGKKAKVNLVRYADDLIITGSSKELLENEVKPLVVEFLAQRGLELSPTKTHITHINEGFDFLGQTIRKYGNGKLLIKPAKTSIKKHLSRVRTVIKTNKSLGAGKLIAQLNPIIRGWANYHRHVVSKRTFAYVDHQIFKTLWQWAKRRHPTKGRKWIKTKYFQSTATRNWLFSGKVVGKDGQIHHLTLVNAAKVPIQRHLKIQNQANPYDPEWELYFEKRLDVKTAQDLKGKRDLLRLWKDQNGICPVCEQKITKLTSWHSHHIKWKVYGGTDGAENRVLLHPNCHRQVHSQKLSVAKPRASQSVR